MIVGLILLAILTIGAVSASDTSDELAVSDESDIVGISLDDQLGDMGEGDVNIEVNDINTDESSSNFTTISLTEKAGNYVICTGEGDDTVELYREDLSVSERDYQVGEKFCFGVSLDDVNSYISANVDGKDNFYDVVDNGNVIRFVLEYQDTDFAVRSYQVNTEDNLIKFNEEGPGISIWVDEENSYTTDENSVDADERFANIATPEGTDGNVRVSISSGETSFFSKKLSEFNEEKVDGHDSGVVYYNISPKDVNFFNGLEDEAEIEIAVWNPDDDEEPIAYNKYQLAFNGDDSTFTLSGIREGDDADEDDLFAVNPDPINREDADAVVATVKGKSINKVSIKDTTTGVVLFDSEIEVPDEGYDIGLTALNLVNVNDKDIISFVYYYENDDGELENSTQYYAIKVTADSIQLFECDPVTILEFYSFYGDLTIGNHNEMGWLPDGKFFEIISPEIISEITVTVNGTGFSRTYTIDDMRDEFNLQGNYIYYRSGYSYFVMLNDEIKNSLPENEVLTFNYVCGDANITQKRIRYNNYVKKILTPDDIATLFTITVADGKLSDVNEVAVSIYPTFFANIQSIGVELDSGYFNVYVNNTVKQQVYLSDLCWGRLVNLDLTLADLEITEPSTYNIKVTHFPDYPGEIIDHAETEIIVQDVVYNNTNVAIDISGVNSDVVITLTAERDKAIVGADIVYSLNGGSEVDATTDENGKVNVAAPEGDVLVSVKYGDKEESKTLYFRVSTGMAISSAQNDVVITLTDAFGNRVSGVGITYRLNNGDKIDAATDANGQVIITPLEGTVKVIGSFAGTVAFKASSAVETLNLPVIPKETTLAIDQGNASAAVTLLCGESSVAGANVTYAVNDVESTGVTDENGTFKITNLTGEVALKVTYLGSDAYKASNATAAFNFTAADDNSTGDNGTGNNTSPGGNTEPGNNTNPDQNTTVVKTATVLTAPGFSMVYLNGDSLVIILKDVDGNAISGALVSVDFGNAVYNVTTDADGKALRSIRLAPKTYTATVTYAGNDTYAASTVTSKITVTKGNPALTAKAKTFKAKTATKKYTVTLKYKGKAANKVKLTLKIGSKTFKATTDANGKATFKITKVTTKKTYTCTVKSKANNLYKAVSKKVKIKIS